MFDTKSAENLIDLALQEDLGERGDVSSRATIPATTQISGRITAKAEGVIAGLKLVKMVYQKVDPTVTVELLVKDGAHVAKGTVVCQVQGSAQSVLTGERVSLNFLQRLSGVATLTAQFVGATAG